MSNLESITISYMKILLALFYLTESKQKKVQKVKNAGQKVVTPGLRDKVENSGRIPGNPGQLVSLIMHALISRP